MSIRDMLGDFFKGTIIKDVKSTVKDTMDDIEKKTQRIVKNVIKSTVVLLIVIFGLVFALVGFSRYLTETVPSLDHGLGYVIVGGSLMLLGIFAKLIQKE